MNEEEIKRRFESIEKRLDLLEENKVDSQKEESKVKKEKFNGDLFEINEERVIVTKFPGENNEDKIKNIALLSLLGYKLKFAREKVLSTEIRENVALNMIPLENFGTYLKKLIPRYILRIGKPKSNKVEYKLTIFGEAFTKSLLKEMLEDEKSK